MTDLQLYNLELRNQIYEEIMSNDEIMKDIKELGPDAYLAASRVRWACGLIAKGIIKPFAE